MGAAKVRQAPLLLLWQCRCQHTVPSTQHNFCIGGARLHLFLCALQQYFIYVWVMPESNYPPRACLCLPPAATPQSGGAGEGFEVTKYGDGRVALIGFPSGEWAGLEELCVYFLIGSLHACSGRLLITLCATDRVDSHPPVFQHISPPASCPSYMPTPNPLPTSPTRLLPAVQSESPRC